MWNFLKKIGATLGSMFTSKKFLTTAVGTVTAIASGTPVGIAILAGAGTYVLGQGIADHGKSAALIVAGK